MVFIINLVVMGVITYAIVLGIKTKLTMLFTKADIREIRQENEQLRILVQRLASENEELRRHRTTSRSPEWKDGGILIPHQRGKNK